MHSSLRFVCFSTTALVAVALLHTGVAQAQQAVVPSALTNSDSDSILSTPAGTSARTIQFQIAASELAVFAGSGQIGSISFRLDSGASAPTSNLTFSNYEVVLSQAANTMANFSTTTNNGNNFAANLLNPVTVRNSSLTLLASSFSTGGSPNAFGPTVNFTTPYTYLGGDLVITIRHTGNGTTSPFLDATTTTEQGYGTLIKGHYSTAGANATTSNANGIASVMRLNGITVATAPEPGTLALLTLGGLGMVGMAVRKRRN
jgi:hypothetical protein